MELHALFQTRRSVRDFQAEQGVSRAAVEELLRAAQLAPTWKNSQTGRYYVAQSPDLAAQVREALPAFNQDSSAGAPVLIVTTFVRDVSGYTHGQPDNELGNQWGAYDLGLQNAYLVLKASDLGLDTLIMGIRDAQALRRLFQIPDNEEIAAVIALGRRAGEPVFRPRKPLEEIARFF